MQSEGIITLAEPKKGVETVSSVNFLHPKLENFRVVKYEETQQANATEKEPSYEPPGDTLI